MAYLLVLNSTAVEVPLFYRQVLLSLVVSIGIAWLITLRRKVSMHMMVQGGTLAVYTHVAASKWPVEHGGHCLGAVCRTGGLESAHLGGTHAP